MIRQPPRSTRTDTLFPYTTLFRSADRAVDETLAGEDDGNGDMAVERQLAPLVDRLALGGKDDVAVEDQPPGANALDDLWHTRREPHEIAIFLHQRVGNALFEREARLFVHVADPAMHWPADLRAQTGSERARGGNEGGRAC